MDGQRFDAWTRALAGAVPRRGALKTVAGLALAGAATRSVLHDVEAFCADEGQDCGMPCCEGLVCDDGYCVTVGSPQCPTLNQANECSNATSCEGNGCKKKKKKRGKKRRKSRNRR